MMYVLPSTVALTVFLVCYGVCEESASDVTTDSAHDTSPAPHVLTKRAVDYKRLSRGLHMLRLGKRGRTIVPEDSSSKEQIQTLLDILQSYADEDVSDEYDDVLYPYEVPMDRLRRSTVPPPDDEEEEEEPQSNLQSQIDGLGDAYYGSIPGDFFDDEFQDYLQPEEGGEESEGSDSIEGPDMEKKQDEDVDGELQTEKRPMSMLRLGKRPMSMLRLGKRPMSMLRLGKRPMSMLRLGKRPMSMLRLGKRPMSMLRLGKRPMSMLRLGKRPMSMLRLGKRPMSMLRLGKRPMSMLRLGKRPMSMLRLGKRPMSMLRLGKRPMSMLRLGKRSEQ